MVPNENETHKEYVERVCKKFVEQLSITMVKDKNKIIYTDVEETFISYPHIRVSLNEKYIGYILYDKGEEKYVYCTKEDPMDIFLFADSEEKLKKKIEDYYVKNNESEE